MATYQEIIDKLQEQKEMTETLPHPIELKLNMRQIAERMDKERDMDIKLQWAEALVRISKIDIHAQ